MTHPKRLALPPRGWRPPFADNPECRQQALDMITRANQLGFAVHLAPDSLELKAARLYLSNLTEVVISDGLVYEDYFSEQVTIDILASNMTHDALNPLPLTESGIVRVSNGINLARAKLTSVMLPECDDATAALGFVSASSNALLEHIDHRVL